MCAPRVAITFRNQYLLDIKMIIAGVTEVTYESFGASTTTDYVQDAGMNANGTGEGTRTLISPDGTCSKPPEEIAGAIYFVECRYSCQCICMVVRNF